MTNECSFCNLESHPDSLLESSLQSRSVRGFRACNVHLCYQDVCLAWLSVKILEVVRMKYTTLPFLSRGAIDRGGYHNPPVGQTPPAAYVARITSAVPGSNDDPQDRCSLSERVDEVNVLFMPDDIARSISFEI